MAEFFDRTFWGAIAFVRHRSVRDFTVLRGQPTTEKIRGWAESVKNAVEEQRATSIRIVTVAKGSLVF